MSADDIRLGLCLGAELALMVGLVLVSLTLGIALTIGSVAVVAILARQRLGLALASYLPALDFWGRIAQGLAGGLIVAIGAYTLWQLRA